MDSCRFDIFVIVYVCFYYWFSLLIVIGLIRELICLLLQKDRWTALHNASNEGHAGIVEIILNHNADINVVTKVI